MKLVVYECINGKPKKYGTIIGDDADEVVVIQYDKNNKAKKIIGSINLD